MRDNKTDIMQSAKRIASLTVLLLMICAIGFVAGRFLDKDNLLKYIGGEKGKLTVETVKETLEPASDLVTARYLYTNSVSSSKVKQVFGKTLPLTEDRVVFLYEGTISAGFDLSQADYTVDNEKKEIRVRLPKISIVANEIDTESFEYPYEKDSVLNQNEMDETIGDIDKLKKQMEDKAKGNDEFIRTAQDNAENVIRNFLTLSDATKDFSVIFE